MNNEELLSRIQELEEHIVFLDGRCEDQAAAIRFDRKILLEWESWRAFVNMYGDAPKLPEGFFLCLSADSGKVQV